MSQESHTNHKIYLAALLHDIGKFFQRADKADNAFDSGKIDSHLKELGKRGDVARLSENGFPVYGHVLYTAQFLEGHKDLWSKFFGDEKESQDNFINLSIYHHYPVTPLQEIIQRADHWASGTERVVRDEKDMEMPSDYRDRSVENIFYFLHKKDQDIGHAEKVNIRYNLSPLNIASSLFLNEKENYNYEKLWEKFKKEFDDLKNKNIREVGYFTESVLFLMKKYTWCIPSTTRKQNYHDISLFEHSKITAALATCFYVYLTENQGGKITGDNLKSLSEQYPVLLTCVDVVGIQQYIYNIVDRKAARSLKARSFYVQLLSETVVTEILEGLSLTYGQVIYNSGGKAYLMLPNTEKTKNFLEVYRRSLEKWLLCAHELDIYVTFDYIPFRYDGEKGRYFAEGIAEGLTLGELWTMLVEKTSERKYRRYASLEEEVWDELLSPYGAGGDQQISDISGMEEGAWNFCRNADSTGNSNPRKISEYDELLLTQHELMQLQMGKGLHNARYLLQTRDRNNIENAGLGNKYTILIHRTWWALTPETPTSFDNGKILHLVKDGEVILSDVRGNSVKGFRFYGGLNIPLNAKEEIKTFEELCEGEEGEFRKMGILRMDVDNLGKIFKDGFGEEVNFARLSQLSFSLDWFFSGYLNHLHQNHFKEHLIVIYSGGDDLFAVGDWEKILEFAIRIRKEFHDFTLSSPYVTLSGGLEIVGPKFPIRKGALMSGEAEERAKKCNIQGTVKNALGLLNDVVSWKELANLDKDDSRPGGKGLRTIEEIKNMMVDLCRKEVLTSSFLQRMQQYYLLDKNYREGKGDLSYRWNGAYWLTRYLESKKEKIEHEGKDFMEGLHEELGLIGKEMTISSITDDRAFVKYGVAARWSELCLRKDRKKIEKSKLK